MKIKCPICGIEDKIDWHFQCNKNTLKYCVLTALCKCENYYDINIAFLDNGKVDISPPKKPDYVG